MSFSLLLIFVFCCFSTYSASQARSLASYMHDADNYFQHFALDFNEGFSAFHGSDIFAQAHITNKAINKIRSLYKKKPEPIGKNVALYYLLRIQSIVFVMVADLHIYIDMQSNVLLLPRTG